jgi:hypothetical protein
VEKWLDSIENREGGSMVDRSAKKSTAVGKNRPKIGRPS